MNAANVTPCKTASMALPTGAPTIHFPWNSARSLAGVSHHRQSPARQSFSSPTVGPAIPIIYPQSKHASHLRHFPGGTATRYGAISYLSAETGGKFYLIPQNRPDSLITVVNKILNILLLQFNPTQVVVTNSTLAPAQTSSSTGFLTQGDSISWRVVLDNIVALQPNSSNHVSLISKFTQVQNPAVSESDTTQFILSTTGPAAAGAQVISPYNLETRCYLPSKLQWLTNAGVRPPYFTEADSNNVRLQLRTSDSGLASVSAALSTHRPTVDAETGALPRTAVFADSTRFSTLISMRVAAAATAGDGTLEPFYFDSLIARWAHPRDPSDTARDTILVRPANVQATTWFAADSAGTPVAGGVFPGSATAMWIVVQDNRATPGLAYSVTITSDSLGTDQITLTLAPVPGRPGVFTVQIPFAVNSVKTTSDGTLQISPAGDQLHAAYTDPFYGDKAQAAAGFGVSVEEPAALVFTDAGGTVLPDSAIWSLSHGQVYVKFTDDKVDSVRTVPVHFQVNSLKLGQAVATDQESGALLNPLAVTQTLNAWSDSFAVAEQLHPTANNGVLEGGYRMVVIASVPAHDNVGQPTGQTVTRTLVLAWPDSQPSLTFAQHVNTVNPKGPVDVVLTLTDQDFVHNAPDTVTATALCPASGDSVAGLRFSQTAVGTYVSDTLFRNGAAANTADGVLSCPAGGDVVIDYTDPVYGGVSTWTLHEAAMPAANPADGTVFTSQLDVALTSATPGALLTYTLNDSVPVPGRPLVYSGPIPLIAADTLEAVASANGYLRSWVMTAIYPHQPKPSAIRILDANGNPVPGRTLTDAAGAVQIQLQTSQGGLGAVSASIRSAHLGDAENPVLGTQSFDGQTHVYTGNIDLKGGAAVASSGDDTLQTALPDTLIATWRNPLDSADVVADTVFIVPGYVASTVCFSASLGGACLNPNQYNNGTTTAYVVVHTRAGVPGQYAVTVSSSTGGSDAVNNIPLLEIGSGSGVYSAAVTLQEGPKNPTDSILQVSVLDQLLARFIHPVYHDTTYDAAGYGQLANEVATLRFLDTLGNVLAPNALYSTANGRIGVRYVDDYSAAIAAKVDDTLRLINDILRSGVSLGGDTEKVVLAYDTAVKAWTGTVILRDNLPRSGDDTVESEYRGQLTGVVNSHDDTGAADGGAATAKVVIAYPDQNAALTVTDTHGGGSVTRLTDSLSITLRDQIFTLAPGAKVAVSVSCLGSGDHEDTVWLVSRGDGTYTLTAPLPKDEQLSGTPTANDGRLACRENDIVQIDYVDPVYGSPLRLQVSWTESSLVKLWFESAADSAHIVSVADGAAARFLAVVQAASTTRNRRDTLGIVFTTPQGERETFPAVETGVYTGLFIASVPYGFTLAAPVRDDRNLEAELVPGANTAVVATATVLSSQGDSTAAEITLFSQFDAVVRGYVRDRDGDGRADAVYLVFGKKPPRLPASLDSLYWNDSLAADRRSVSGSQLSLSPDSLTLIADLSGDPFPQFLTGISGGGTPTALLPADAVFGGVHVPLADSVGPVPMAAVKHPSDLHAIPQGNGQSIFVPDTLVITVSEPIQTQNTWDGVFRYSKSSNCSDSAAYLSSAPISTAGFGEPVPNSDQSQFTLYVNNQVFVGNCIYLERNGTFTDRPGNAPGRLGINLGGADPVQVIRDMAGYPPVAGLPLQTPQYQVVNQDSRVLTAAGGTGILWIPPVDWNEGQDYHPVVNVSPGDPPKSGAVDHQGQVELPTGISVVQVITSGRYVASISLFDQFGNFVKSWQQQFGYDGELTNPLRITDKGVRSYLVWDERGANGQLAGNGVYVWRVYFRFDANKDEVRLIRTGLVRP